MIDLSRFQAKAIRRDEKIKSAKKAIKLKQRFTTVQLQEAAVACKVTRAQQAFVWIWLQYLAWEAHYKPFPVTSVRLKIYGIGRLTKMRALAAFEKAGLISVVRYKTKAPVVTLKAPV